MTMLGNFPQRIDVWCKGRTELSESLRFGSIPNTSTNLENLAWILPKGKR